MAYEFTNTKSLSATCPVSAYPFTMAGWFNISGATQRLFIIGPAGNLSHGIFTSTNRISAFINFGATYQEFYATGTYTNNTWVHACVVFALSTSRTVYRDGGNAASNSVNATPTSAVLEVLNISFSSTGIVGSAADCAVWNTALSAAEVASLAKGFSASLIQPGNLVFYAPLIRDLNDISGSATITNNGTATVSTHPRIYGL